VGNFHCVAGVPSAYFRGNFSPYPWDFVDFPIFSKLPFVSLLYQVLVKEGFYLIREPTVKHKEAPGKTCGVVGCLSFVNCKNENVFAALVPRYVTGHCFI